MRPLPFGIAFAIGAAAPVAAQCAEWSNGFHANGTDSTVTALETWNDGSGEALFVGGIFHFAREVEGRGVARWDGTQWSDLAGGLTMTTSGSSGPWVRDFIAHDDGSGPSLFASGRFETAGGSPAAHIARWDGSAWHPLGAGLGGGFTDVWGLAVFDDGSGTGPELYAVGGFSTAGGAPIQGVARWDGFGWNDVGNWGTSDVRCARVYDDGSGPGLYVGGNFETPLNNFDGIARWDGTSWSAVGGFADDDVWALEVHDDGSGAGPQLFAGGQFNFAGISRLASWDGNSWTKVNCQLVGNVFDLRSAPEPGTGLPTLYSGGYNSVPSQRILQWNGTACSLLGTGTNGDVNAIASFDDGNGPRIYAGGRFQLAGGQRADHIAVWDGTGWSPVSTGLGASWRVEALCVADVGGTGPKLYGDIGMGASWPDETIDRFDGTSWKEVAVIGGAINALGTYDDGLGERLLVGGSFKTAAGVPVKNVAAWDGSSWSSMLGGVSGGEVETFGHFDFGAGAELVVGGSFNNPGSKAARWNGGAWTPLASGFDKRVLAFDAFDEGAGPRLFAGGHLTRKLPLSGTNIIIHRLARWDGSAWTKVHTNDIDEPVRALATFDDGAGPILVLGGEFDTPSAGIATWDGTAWGTMAGGVTLTVGNGRVNAMLVHDDGSGPALYVGGRFDFAGGIAAQNIARWDGGVWTPLDSGIDGEVLTLAVHDRGAGPELYVGGWFRRAGGESSYNLARWGRATCVPIPYCTAGVSTLGCTAVLSGSGAASASGASRLELSVTGADGNRSATIFYGIGGRAASVWTQNGGSVLCVKGPLQRTGMQSSGGTTFACDGTLALNWNAFLASRPNALGNPAVAGRTVWAQAWVYDGGVTKRSQLSNGLEFGVNP